MLFRIDFALLVTFFTVLVSMRGNYDRFVLWQSIKQDFVPVIINGRCYGKGRLSTSERLGA